MPSPLRGCRFWEGKAFSLFYLCISRAEALMETSRRAAPGVPGPICNSSPLGPVLGWWGQKVRFWECKSRPTFIVGNGGMQILGRLISHSHSSLVAPHQRS